MGKTYIAADMKLFDKAAARKLGLTIDQYNNYIVNKINATIPNKEDHLLLCGIVSAGTIEDTLTVLSKIEAKKILLKNNDTLGTREQWHDIGIYICETDGAQEVNINNKLSFIILLASTKYLHKYVDLDNVYIAGAESDIKIKDMYKKPFLNISLEKWDYCPIEIGQRLPQIIDDMELFASMEEDKEEIIS